MEIQKLPQGLVPVMLTPFKENYQIDVNGLEKLTHFYMENGAQGMFSNCLSSEMFQLDDEERLLLNRTVVDATQGKVPVIASGTFGASIERSADFIKKVYQTGVVAVIVISNQIARSDEGDDVFKSRIEELMKQTGDIPLGIYECPYPYKRLISPELMQWLLDTGRFVYHKDTSCDPGAIESKLGVVKDSPFSFFNADTPTALISLKAGAKGISPIGANLYPELYSSLLSLFREGGKEETVKSLSNHLTVLDSVVDLCYPFSAKYFLQLRNFPISTTCRITHDDLEPKTRLKLQAIHEILPALRERYVENKEVTA